MNGSRSFPLTPHVFRSANARARSRTLRWSSGGNESSLSEISAFSEELAMIHLRDRTGAAGRRNWGLTCSRARAVSLSFSYRSIMRLPLRMSRRRTASYLEVAPRISGGVADRRGNTLAAGRGGGDGDGAVGFGRIWPCIGGDAMRSKAGVKQLRTVRLRFATSEGA